MSSSEEKAASELEYVKKYNDLREKYIATGLYLGTRDPAFRSNVAWEKNENEDVLINKSTIANEKSSELELILIAEISTAHFFMTADAGYTGKIFGGGEAPKFENTKANCILTAPRNEPWKTDFVNALGALRWLEDQKATRGNERVGLFKDEAKTMVKVVHRLFKQQDALTAMERDFIDSITEPSLMIDQWPVRGDNMNHLENIKDSHVVFPILAYDIDGKLIEPEQYRQKLSGALVECHLSLSHWSISRDVRKVDAFNAKLISFKILEIPRPPPASPRKRRLFMNINDDQESPLNKLQKH